MDASTASATNYLKKFTKHGGLVEGSGFEKDFFINCPFHKSSCYGSDDFG